jgi:hypothetical protein
METRVALRMKFREYKRLLAKKELMREKEKEQVERYKKDQGTSLSMDIQGTGNSRSWA